MCYLHLFSKNWFYTGVCKGNANQEQMSTANRKYFTMGCWILQMQENETIKLWALNTTLVFCVDVTAQRVLVSMEWLLVTDQVLKPMLTVLLIINVLHLVRQLAKFFWGQTKTFFPQIPRGINYNPQTERPILLGTAVELVKSDKKNKQKKKKTIWNPKQAVISHTIW